MFAFLSDVCLLCLFSICICWFNLGPLWGAQNFKEPINFTVGENITIMVTLHIVSEYDTQPPEPSRLEEGRCYIDGGPLYDLDRVKALAFPDSSQLWTKRCRDRVQDLNLDLSDVCELISELAEGHYLKSEWCKASGGSGTIAASDSYKIVRDEYHAFATGNKVRAEYYIKLAIGKLGLILLIVSCHNAEW